MLRISVVLALLLACNGDVGGGGDAGMDPTNADASADASASDCAPEDLVEWFADVDSDGFGDLAQTMTACEKPFGYADKSGDCNDSDPTVNPSSAELCDGVDNDCEPATVETCPSQCAPRTLGGSQYLICNEATPWADALAVCMTQQMLLTRVDDQTELDLLIAARLEVFGNTPETWIGANDLGAEDNWQWPDGEQFWQGKGNGTVVGGLFNAWRNTQPDNANSNNNAIENCAIIESGGSWDDKQCPQARRFICERYLTPE